jgi:alpha-galactosidase
LVHHVLTYGLSFWLPYQGTGAIYGKHIDTYWIRGSMVAEFTFGPDAAGMAAADLPLQKRMVDEFHRIADCFLGDFYPLTPYSRADDCWMAWQFDLPEAGEGVVRAFRRGKCVYEAARFPLRGLDPDAKYSTLDLDTGETAQASGRDLTLEELRVDIRSRPGSAVLTYRRISR